MADVNDGDILRLGCGLIYDGIYDIVNVYHIRVETTAGLTWATVTPYIQGYVDGLYDNIKSLLHDDMGTGVISVSNVTQATTLGAIAWSPTWGGAETGDPTAAGVSCFAWGRTYKPRVQLRKYLGVFGEVSVTNGSWVVGVQNACIDLMDDHISRQLRATGVYFTGVAYNRTLATYQLGVSSDASAEPAYQRRRKRGRGS